MAPRRILGLDPGLQRTGWGMITVDGPRLSHLGHGVVTSDSGDDLPTRLTSLFQGLQGIISNWAPDEAAVEETFVNKNPVSTLKLGSARGVVVLAPALAGLHVGEYPANLVKKSVVGAGHADKDQVLMMINTLLPTAKVTSPDAADALAVAICHAHHRQTHKLIGGKMSGSAR